MPSGDRCVYLSWGNRWQAQLKVRSFVGEAGLIGLQSVALGRTPAFQIVCVTSRAVTLEDRCASGANGNMNIGKSVSAVCRTTLIVGVQLIGREEGFALTTPNTTESCTR